MQYKGEDLDLRVPHLRAPRESYPADYDAPAGNGRWARSQPVTNGGEPLWVDEVLLACCNYAFDVAQANGAAEVGLEHLVNALTRVDGAARILEARGVREGQLRRESAALIASEIPAANAGEAATPRRSAELEDVLRRASEVAHRRGSPAAVDDVLWVLLHWLRELPVVLLLRRLTPDWQRADWGRLRERETQGPERPERPVAVQLVANDSVNARMASIEDSLRLMQSELMADRKLLMDLVRDIQRDVVAQRGDGAAFRGDLGQRLESLERAVHTRVDTGRLPAQIADRMAQLEKTLHGGLGDALRGTRDLATRITSLETSVTDLRTLQSPEPVGERISTLEKAVHTSLAEGARHSRELGHRIGLVETTLGELRAMPNAEPVGERLAALETAITGSTGEGARAAREIGQRLSKLEVAVGQLETGPAVAKVLSERMSTLEKAVHSGLGEGARNWSHLGQRLNQIEASVTEAREPAILAAMSERIGGLEHAVEASLSEGARNFGHIGQRLVAFESTLVEMAPAKLGQTVAASLGASLAGLEKRLDTAREETERQRSAAVERVRELGRLVDAIRGEAGSVRSEVSERLTLLESRLLDSGATPDLALQSLTQRLGGLEQAVRAGFGDTSLATTQIADRLMVVERGISERPRDEGDALLILDDRLGAIERMLDTRGQETLSITQEIGERLRIIEQRPSVSGTGLDMGSLMGPLEQRLVAIEGSSVARVEGLQAGLADVVARIERLDERARAEALVTEEALRGRDQDFDFIYSEIKQLGQSQATLNSAVNDWRNESQEHFGTLAARLDRLPSQPPAVVVTETAGSLPPGIRPGGGTNPVIVVNGTGHGRVEETSATDVANGASATDYALPEAPERGFWHWLFGTPSVRRANRDSDLKVARMRQNIREARERRRMQV
ncbi:MAG: Clp protease N-terminal domain-containing protein [Hyphomicrobiaceae bacterium]